MRVTIYILLFYLFSITALPSVRALKVQFGSNCEHSCSKKKQNECDNAKFVMSLNFSPLQFVNEIQYSLTSDLLNFDKQKQKSFYDAFFISKYLNSIWNPPKLM